MLTTTLTMMMMMMMIIIIIIIIITQECFKWGTEFAPLQILHIVNPTPLMYKKLIPKRPNNKLELNIQTSFWLLILEKKNSNK